MLGLVQNQLEAYNQHNLEKFCECYHQEVTVLRLLVGKTVCRGLDAFRGVYSKLFETSPNLRCEIVSRVVLDGAVVDEEVITGAINFPTGLHAVVVYGFRDQLIDRVWLAR